jgi:hypothetical protein
VEKQAGAALCLANSPSHAAYEFAMNPYEPPQTPLNPLPSNQSGNRIIIVLIAGLLLGLIVFLFLFTGATILTALMVMILVGFLVKYGR